ncbi:hypothetical protein [Rhodococcus sp. 14C212]|nr:hypothetical protein [Rhodococcus sp. 14C212]
MRAWEEGRTIRAALRRAARCTDPDESRAVVERAVIRLLRRA